MHNSEFKIEGYRRLQVGEKYYIGDIFYNMMKSWEIIGDRKLDEGKNYVGIVYEGTRPIFTKRNIKKKIG